MKTVFIDVDTQLDFLYPAGALYVPGAETIVPAIFRLNRYAAEHGHIVVSTADAHSEDDPEFATWPPHCVTGTTGQHKAAATVLEHNVVIPNVKRELALDGASQLIVEKQTLDAFATHTLARILDRLAADRFVLYGVVTEICVLWAARGLLARRKPVAVVTDAIRELRPEDSSRALEEIRSLGGTVSTVADICRD